MKLPINIHSFSEIRTKGYPYVDKTDIIYEHLIHGSYHYMSICRPKGFGKSLLLSTIKAYFEGKKELFEGLAIEKLNPKWVERPVFLFDLGKDEYKTEEDLLKVLDKQLSYYEKSYGLNSEEYYEYPGLRINRLIRESNRKTDKGAVVLVDDYDKPILDTLETKEEDKVRGLLKSFLMCFKSSIIQVSFGIITGKTRLGKLSIFSDINNISDLSPKSRIDTLCGFTSKEIMDNFGESLTDFSQFIGVTNKELMDRICDRYEGYRFSESQTKVMNPFSILNALASKRLDDYWFRLVDPRHMVELMIQNNYDLSDLLENSMKEKHLYRCEHISITPMLYQNGYLTITDYDDWEDKDDDWDFFQLDFPNKEVEENFLNLLLPYYTQMSSETITNEITKLVEEIQRGDIDAFMNHLQSVFFPTPYYPNREHEYNADGYYSPYQWARIQEIPLHNLLFLVCTFMDKKIPTKLIVYYERTILIIWASDCIYLMEFIADSTPEKTLEVLKEKGYRRFLNPGELQARFVGVNYSTSARNITGWQIED